MKHYTNTTGLPDFIYNLLSHDWYGGTNAKHDFSVTQMCNPVNMTILQNRHKDEIVEDIIDQYVNILGTGVHYLAELANKDKGFLVEERKYTTILDRVISGQVDLFSPLTGRMIDYKITKATTFIFGSRSEKYKAQLNFNKYLFEKNGYRVNSLDIVEFYRDFDEKTAKIDPKYPKSPIQVIPIPMLTNSAIEYEIRRYIMDYNKYIEVADSELPPCSVEERWERGGGFAVMKTGNTRATKLCNTKAEAEAYRGMNCKLSETYIEERPVTPIRCIDWCNVNKFCPFYKNYIQEKENEGKEKSDNARTCENNSRFGL